MSAFLEQFRPEADHNERPAFFPTNQIGLNELRQPSTVTDSLRDDPWRVLEITRYSTPEGAIISNDLWEFLQDVLAGRAQIFQVESSNSKGTFQKEVLVTERPVSGPFQTFLVRVDRMEYQMSVLGSSNPETRRRPDDSLIWRHHEDVAREVLERFPWTDDHRRRADALQATELDDPRKAIARAEVLAMDLDVAKGILSLLHPRDADLPVEPTRYTSLEKLVDAMAEMIEEAFDEDVARDASPNGGIAMGRLREDPRELAVAALLDHKRDELIDAGWPIEDMADDLGFG